MGKKQKKQRKAVDRKPTLGKRQSDLGTPELENHHVLEIRYVDSDGEPTTPDKGVKQAVNRTQNTLDYCFWYGLITEEQYLAGERLYRDCYYAGLTPRAVMAKLDNPIRGSRNLFHFIESKVEAEMRYAFLRKNLNQLYVDRQHGITFWQIAQEVCCEGLSLDGLEKRVGWTRRSGKLLLRMVLDEVGYWYRGFYKNAGDPGY